MSRLLLGLSVGKIDRGSPFLLMLGADLRRSDLLDLVVREVCRRKGMPERAAALLFPLIRIPDIFEERFALRGFASDERNTPGKGKEGEKGDYGYFGHSTTPDLQVVGLSKLL